MIEEDGLDPYCAHWVREVRKAVRKVPVTPHTDLNNEDTKDMLAML